ncbi:MAG: hypothetical protein H7343_10250, partial [Undibacterium sp.]|nr:hypothetical protein [Opitutaceae bacterium]
PAAPTSSVPAHLPGTSPTPAPSQPANATQSTPPPPARAEISGNHLDLTAEGYLRAGYVIADTVLEAKGEWQPDDKSEHDALKAAAVAYLKTNSGEPLPPGVAFAVSLGVYAFKRLSRTNTAKALRYLWQKATGARPAPVHVAPSEPQKTNHAPAPAAHAAFEMPHFPQ